MFQMKRKNQKIKLTTKSGKKRRYRWNVRYDAARLDNARKKNRECKNAKKERSLEASDSKWKHKTRKIEQDAKKHLRWKDTEIKRKQRTEKN
jgi:hypothetical protein